MNFPQFNSYETAALALELRFPIQHELNGDDIYGLESVKLVTDVNSYNYEMSNFQRIYVVGSGLKSGPGHPIAHQNPLRQKMINKANYNRNKIHVFHENQAGEITYRGLYQINSTSRQITNAGWVYFQIELINY